MGSFNGVEALYSISDGGYTRHECGILMDGRGCGGDDRYDKVDGAPDGGPMSWCPLEAAEFVR